MSEGRQRESAHGREAPVSRSTAADGQGRPGLDRPRVHGKFLSAGGERLDLRGVTYGTFRPRENGCPFPEPARVQEDFAAMAGAGFNAVRTYTVPPRWMLDLAEQHSLRLLVCLPWEQHVAFLDDRSVARSVERRVRDGVRACRGHPAVLAYAIGNEIPASIVRWHGRRAVERFLRRLCDAARDEDPGSLTTYVNFPSTEYLELPFVDFLAFNVYLESRDRFAAYLARLQHLAGDRPLVMAEIGLDSRRNGEEAQAESLAWQVRTAASSGCAGVFVFAWTDEWHRGGHDVDDWDFGLTTRGRGPKPALEAVRDAMADPPLGERDWPRASVVVCALNAERTIAECLDGVAGLDYPDYEVIVVDDGSTDATAAIAATRDVHLIRTPNRGLSSARNTGLAAATGAIVAYLDSDASPDRGWLRHLAASFLETSHAAVGGPNIATGGAGRAAECVAHAPGWPAHVLLTDLEAEHLPGCNMAFRRECLVAIGGFDPRFRTAGDDVDACWRIRERGGTLGFNPAAAVWHRPRDSVRAYWRQQRGYGRAEALLERKWPEKYNEAGHISWQGRVYGSGLARGLLAPRGRIYHGTWNSAPFQRLYQPRPGALGSLSMLPEWHLATAGLALVGLFGVLWPPLLVALLLAGLAVAISALQAALGGRASAPPAWRRRGLAERAALLGLTAWLHFVQPLARLWGRVGHGLAPWRGAVPRRRALPFRTWKVWSERWRALDERLRRLEARLRAGGLVTARGGHWDPWDLEVRAGPIARARLRVAVEEHGAGRQLLRLRAVARPKAAACVLAVILLVAASAAALAGAWVPAAGIGALGAAVLLVVGRECAALVGALREASLEAGDPVPEPTGVVRAPGGPGDPPWTPVPDAASAPRGPGPVG